MSCLQAQDAAGDAAGSAKSATGDVSGSAKSAGGDVASSAKSAAGDAKGAAQSAGRQIDQATPDLSGVFDGILDKVCSGHIFRCINDKSLSELHLALLLPLIKSCIDISTSTFDLICFLDCPVCS